VSVLSGERERAASPRSDRGDGPVVVSDRFADDRRVGRVIGTPSTGGPPRRGVDVEGVIGIDHGALRIQPLVRPGFGRSGIAYGPVRREPGMTLAVYILNGHNLSRTYELSSVARQIWRWMRAAESDPLVRRGINWLLHHRPRETLLRKVRGWYASRKVNPPRPELRENLAVGWFAGEAPTDPLRDGHAFVVHAPEDLDNGVLWSAVAGRGLPAFKSFQNVPVYYVVALRERGAAYYVSSLPGAHGPGPYPMMRPVAIDPFGDQAEVYAGVHQAVLGEIGFGIDTRVYGVRAQRIGVMTPWCGTAHAADLLDDLPVGGAMAEVGGVWRVQERGVGMGGAATLALLDPGEPTGLAHVLVDPVDGEGGAGLVWRVSDGGECWAAVVGRGRCTVERWEEGGGGGRIATIAEFPLPEGDGERPVSLQVLDDGVRIGVSVNGRMVTADWLTEPAPAGATGVGVVWRGDALPPRRLEAHPREVPIPPALDMGSPWMGAGGAVVLRDTFAGAAGDLAGRAPTQGGGRWRRDLGEGVIDVTGSGAARVRGSPERPNPGRTIYTVDWIDPSFADLEVELTPPGTGRGQKHRSRTGLVFWQDPGNYVLISLWLDDSELPASISSFFCLRGFEDIYDAVWSCIGVHRAPWGAPMKLRIVFDSGRYLVRVNGEPVLYRALTDVYPRSEPLRINRVGVAATWEWGNDTGTVLRDFTARGRA